MSRLDEALLPALQERKKEHLYRQRRTLASPQGAEVLVDGRRCLNFCSNDYLGLANHPKVIAAFQRAAELYGVGSGASHLVVGHSRVHHELEEALADFTGRPRALLFSSGYQANMGTINALVGRGDSVFQDRLNHASLLDGALLSGAKLLRFSHNDQSSLEKRLFDAQSKSPDSRKLVVVDGIFSMDGDAAPLKAYAALCQQYGAWLMVDDAHGLGVCGAFGKGSLELAECDADEVPILMGTLGKAFGTAGAFIAGSEVLVESLIQHARNYIYTTAIPPAVAAATLVSLELIQEEAWRREHLQNLISQFQKGLDGLPFDLIPSHTAIQPLLIGSSEVSIQVSEELLAQNILISAIRPPTVPADTARLRITLSAAHSAEQVQCLLNALAAVADKTQI